MSNAAFKIKEQNPDLLKEHRILTALVVSNKFLERFQNSFFPELFDDPVIATIGLWCMSYYKQFETAPNQHLKDIYNDSIGSVLKDDASIEFVKKFLVKLSKDFENGGSLNEPYLIDSAERYFENKAALHVAKEIKRHPESYDKIIKDHEKRKGAFSPKQLFVGSVDLFDNEPPSPNPVLEDLFDVGDKFAIIGPAKMKKSFFAIQMGISLAAGRDFLCWKNTTPWKVAYVQFELTESWMHRRFRMICRALGIERTDIRDRFQLLNARGKGIKGAKGVESLLGDLRRIKPNIVLFDPLYKISEGVENAAEDTKIILGAFDTIAEKINTAVGYVHHDTKGNSGDKNTWDRGAGSGVIGRDWDACITLDEHETAKGCTVMKSLPRNYADWKKETIFWAEKDGSHDFCFELAPEIIPQEKTNKTDNRKPVLSMEEMLTMASKILGKDEMGIVQFKGLLHDQTRTAMKTVDQFMEWSMDRFLSVREERRKGIGTIKTVRIKKDG